MKRMIVKRRKGRGFRIAAAWLALALLASGGSGIAEQAPAEQASAEQASEEQVPAVQTPAEQAPAEQAPDEQIPAEQASAEQAPAEQAADAQAAPTEEGSAALATSGRIHFTVSGAEVYHEAALAPGAQEIAWSVDGGAQRYWIYLYDDDWSELQRSEDCNMTGFTIDTTGMEPGDTFLLRVGARPVGDAQGDVAWDFLKLTLPRQADLANGVGKPVINLGSAAYQVDGALCVGRGNAVFSWLADGRVGSYTVNLTCVDDGADYGPGVTTDTSHAYDTTQMNAGSYLLRVGATPAGGDEGSTVWSELRFTISDSAEGQASGGESAAQAASAPVIVPFGQAMAFDAQVYADGSARRVANDDPYETLNLTIKLTGHRSPAYFQQHYASQYKLQGDEAVAQMDVTIGSGAKGSVIVQKAIITDFASEDLQTVYEGYQMIDAEIGGTADVSAAPGETVTLYKRYSYPGSGPEPKYLVVRAYVDGRENIYLFELPVAQGAEDTQVRSRSGDEEITSLSPGDESEAVAQLQRALIAKGVLQGSPDGKFGSYTEGAVKAMQERYGMESTGVADEEFLERLYADQ